ncbi:DUF3006 domain-containing protein [Clostridium facile]|uniref:DUF3006 domain-containing protein n=1 Tax=Clostridium facile TaxID=2763035 RepID=A0ABR7IQ08_9CLOT|nr:DUF3006 domain-containing protein [Clostridium facile]MBC5787206.1 DUF3006 domain-containing protein [Clostridium facile]PWM99294.1 MAG: DUF3006 domain-containing protein [Massilioclostridium sp.]
MWSVDRIENGIAVLENDHRIRKKVPLDQLPVDVTEGDVLVVQDDNYVVDQQETNRRREQAFQLQQRLFRKQ